jgi:hyperosmotically inducible protein
MRPRINAVSALFAVALLAVIGMVTGVPSAKAAITPDPVSISKQVHHQLVMLPYYGVFDNLAYEVNGTEVILTGQLISEHDTTKSEAVNAVKRITGVTNVVDKIEVLPVSGFDNQIRRAAYRTIFSKSDLGRYTMGSIPQVHIIVKNGHIFLEGAVMNQMDKTVAGMAANSVPGVFSVTNNLQID